MLQARVALALCSILAIAGCGGPSSVEDGAVTGAAETLRLIDVFDRSMVSGSPADPVVPQRTEWRWDGEIDEHAAEAKATGGWTQLAEVSGLRVAEGLLSGRSTGDFPIVHVERSSGLDSGDTLHSIEVRLRASAGTNLQIATSSAETPALEQLGRIKAFPWEISTPIVAGDDLQTYTLRKSRPQSAASIRHLFIRPTDVADADFAIESVRLIFRQEHLASIPSGISFQGMAEIYRESLVSRSPERIEIPLELGEERWFDLALGTVDDLPVTFRVSASTRDGASQRLLERTVTTPFRWEESPIDLAELAGQKVDLVLEIEAVSDGAVGVWGSPAIHTRRPDDSFGDSPQGVIVLWLDTIRRDHLNAYGYERDTAPTIARMAAEGVRFDDSVSQATWTKVSTPSMMTSTYPLTNGVQSFFDHLPSSAVTMAEVYREAGYATVSYASNLFTGQFTNLHQGYEQLHEDGSFTDMAGSKSSRPIVDRASAWLEGHRDVPFFMFLHLYDAHDPFEPRAPWNGLWADLDKKEQHEADLEAVKEHITEPLAKAFGMPNRAQLQAAGLDPEAFVGYDQDWYDGSIRGMDVEIGRLLETLANLGLDERTLIVLTADHGEEFLDHDSTFHGHTTYGELAGVPLIFNWPGRLPAGTTISQTVSTLDLMPTLLDLSGLEGPEVMQGQSYAGLFSAPHAAGADLQQRSVFTEKAVTDPGPNPWPSDTESYAVVADGWKLIHNRERHEGTPEFELYSRADDPLDQVDLAADNPEIVEVLRLEIDNWLRLNAAERMPNDEDNSEGLSDEQLERLRSLGYIQ